MSVLIPQGTRRSPFAQLGGDTSWVRRPGGAEPLLDFDYDNQRFYGATIPTFFTGPLNFTANGINIVSGVTINGTSTLVTRLPSDYSIFADVAPGLPIGATSSAVVAINNSAPDAPLFIVANAAGNSPGSTRSFHTNTAGSIDSQYREEGFILRSMAMSQGSVAGRSVTMNHTVVTTAATKHAAITSMEIGRYNGGTFLNGDLSRLTIFNSKLSDANLKATTSLPVPVGVTGGYLRGLPQESLSLGANTLQYEYTQPWNFITRIQMIGRPDTTGSYIAAILHTNVSANSGAFPGWETFIFSDGKIRVRIINDIATHYIEVAGTTNLIDGQIHTIMSSYDGSGLAAGVFLTVDGVAEALTVVSDTLAGLSIIGGTQTLLIGNQTNRLGFYWMGFMYWAQFSTIARGANYASQYRGATPPPRDGLNNVMLDFTSASGTSGTTVLDQSGNGINGIVSTADMIQAA